MGRDPDFGKRPDRVFPLISHHTMLAKAAMICWLFWVFEYQLEIAALDKDWEVIRESILQEIQWQPFCRRLPNDVSRA